MAVWSLAQFDEEIYAVTPGDQFPQWGNIKPEHVAPAVKQLLSEEGATLDLLEQDLKRAGKNVSFSRMFLPYTQIRLRVDGVLGQIDHLSAITTARVAFDLRLTQSKVIYSAVRQLRDNAATWKSLDPSQQRIVELTLKQYVSSGVGLAPAERRKFNDVVYKLQRLSTNFSNNVLDSTQAFKMLIKDKGQVAGLQTSTLDVAAQNARAAGHKGASTEKGPWLLRLDDPTYLAVMQFAKDRNLRKKFYTAYRSVASSGTSDNTPVIAQILKLRKEMAAMLGFPNYAQYAFRDRMATLPSATALMTKLADASHPQAQREHEQLTAFARNATGDQQLKLLWWDTLFWAERQKEKKFNLDGEYLRQFLPLDNVLQGLFNLVERLYGVKVSPPKEKMPVWDPAVRVFQVAEASGPSAGKPFAFLYADLFSRPGTKQSGAWVLPWWDRAKYWRTASPAAAAVQSAGSKKMQSEAASIFSASLAQQQAAWLATAPLNLPMAFLITNQNPPAANKPSLMSLNEVEDLFHEFGHALQHLLTQSKYGLTAGMRNLEWDAVEFPSQMQEKWAFDRKTLESFARHWKTNQTLPSWVFGQIRGWKTYRQGNAFAYQLMLALTDLELHSTYQPGGKVKPIDIQQQMYSKIMPLPPSPSDRQLNNFNHIFSGGYASGYYSYMWANVMSADAFKAFMDSGSSDTAVKKVGRRFRDTVLSLGGSRPPAQVFKEFRGRAPQQDALIQYYGLK
eukprot:gene10343-10500_t